MASEWRAESDGIPPRTICGSQATSLGRILRNDARVGAFAPFDGDRIPNRPHLTANLSPSVSLRELLVAADEVTFGVDTSYVHRFYRSWESLGDTETKAEIPSQLVHSAYVSYRLTTDAGSLTQSIEVINLTDEPRYDYFGVQLPPRAAYVKWTFAL
ncbi:MAG: TonB-dependent receptor [Polyangiaceae bacterium]